MTGYRRSLRRLLSRMWHGGRSERPSAGPGPTDPLVLKYDMQKQAFLEMGGVITHSARITSDWVADAGTASGGYFHQDLLVAQFVHEARPRRHIDVGSRVDGFIAHVAAFREVEYYDIRPLPPSGHPNIKFVQADVMRRAEEAITDSLSCLHVIEHMGLGRYGDRLDPNGHIVAFKNLIRMLEPGGVLYLSVPIGMANEVHFNAHRIFHPNDVFSWAPGALALERFDYVDGDGRLHREFDVLSEPLRVRDGCGIYTFRKEGSEG